jgi:serine/threonine protein kinase
MYVSLSPSTTPFSSTSSNIFLQLCTGGDLFTYITGPMGAGNPLCEAEAKFIMYQLLEGLSYLHDLMISHRGEFFLSVGSARS